MLSSLLMMALRGLFRQGSDVTMVRRLTLRVVLSLGAFILLIVGMRQGWIVPHGLRG